MKKTRIDKTTEELSRCISLQLDSIALLFFGRRYGDCPTVAKDACILMFNLLAPHGVSVRREDAHK